MLVTKHTMKHTMKHTGKKSVLARSGITITEVCVALAAGAVVLSATTTVLATRRGGGDAPFKLAVLAQAHACYAADWNERQWSALPYDVGQFNNPCATYPACVPQQLLGFDTNNAMWGFYLGSGSCAPFGYPGSCANWPNYVPLDFTAARGAFRGPNVVGFREYVSQRFYAPEWYAEDDPGYGVASTHFDAPYEFTFSFQLNNYRESSFCLSPAALFNPGVFRARADGGYQSPTQFADSMRTPSVTQCTHPSLKTRMCEYGWFRNAPAEGLSFTAGLASAPYTLFFDGSVASVRMSDAQAQDFSVYDQSPTDDGLWTRETPYQKDGWNPLGDRIDGQASGFHILTRDGILGRDLLTRESNGGGK